LINILGERVVQLFEGVQRAGYYEILFNSNSLASGIYIYFIKASSGDHKDNFTAVKKMLLMK